MKAYSFFLLLYNFDLPRRAGHLNELTQKTQSLGLRVQLASAFLYDGIRWLALRRCRRIVFTLQQRERERESDREKQQMRLKIFVLRHLLLILHINNCYHTFLSLGN